MTPEDERDKTQIGAKPPPKLPTGPPKPTSHEPPATPEPQAPRLESTAEAADDDEATVFEARPRSSFRLQRVQPPGHSEIIVLDRTSYVAGRMPACEIRLYTPSASREHARFNNVGGAWEVEAIGDRVVLVNGTPIHAATRLSHQSVVKLGGDEVVFLDERAALATAAPDVAARPPGRQGWLVLALVLLGAALAAVAWWWSVES
ncbi:MAG: FHA domain-containing protein [Deltaproteobacteria bacterium]|nr:FHA domain-containing protein [Deltaproteobacteria bacterium]